ncbi:MAG: Ig-like domain-containing protein [Desulfobacteria bacterium]
MMKIFKAWQTYRLFTVLLTGFLIAGCGDGGKTGHWLPGDATAPTVTSVVPLMNATGVAINTRITATFSEAMDPGTLTGTTFTVRRGTTAVPGAVTYSGLTAVFTPTDNLAIDNTYTATVTTGARDTGGNALASNFVWTFTTGTAVDTTRPRVVATINDNGAIGVPLNTDVGATFSEAMDPATITLATFTLYRGATAVPGAVTYSGVNAVFNPTGNLLPDTTYTATITTGAEDVAGNALAGNQAPLPAASDYIWSWTTGATADTAAPTVTLTSPADNAAGVAVNSAVNGTFNEAMRPSTISTATFTVRATGPPLGPILAGLVTYSDNIATFTPTDNLAPDTEYTATITSGARDLAGNALVVPAVGGLPKPNPWTFTTGASDGLAPGAVNLRSLSTFVAVAGAGLTNSNSSGVTTLNGNVGLSPTATCLGDGSPCTATNPVINGTLYANDPEGVAAQAKTDLTAAYVDAMGRPPGTTVNDISGMVLPPGVYTSGSTMSVAVGGTVTLDGQGDANAVWIFQIGSSLTVNNSAQVLLINGAKAKNVFWAAFASSTLGSNVDFKGTVLAGASNSVGTDSVVVGRLLCTTGQITLLSNTITLP